MRNHPEENATTDSSVPANPPRERDIPCPGVTKRVVVLCLLLAALFGYIIPIIDYKLFNTFLGGTHLPPGAVAVLLVLLLVVNPLLSLISKRLAFTRNETLTVYTTCLFSCLIPGHGGETFVISNIVAPFYFATPANKWLDQLHGLKHWLTPALNPAGGVNRSVVESWFVGTGGVVPWGAWLAPMLFWVPVVLVSYLMLGCLSVMLRAQWGEREALAFPLLKLPLAMTEDMDRSKVDAHAVGLFFRNNMMWIGFGIAIFIQLMRGLHLYFPDVPTIPLEIDTAPLFAEAPWNQIGAVPIIIYPAVTGIVYLLTTEISFSLWFFFWFIKFQYLVAYATGFPPSSLPNAMAAPGKMFTAYQVAGCYLAYVGMMLWTARRHLQCVARRAFGRATATADERQEAMSYPLAFWGFILSFLFMVGATCAAGVRLDLSVALWASYLIIALGLSRLVVEAGMLLIINQSAPLGGISRLLGDAGNAWLTPANGVMPASLIQSGLVYHMRGLIMPSFLHSLKLAHDRKIAAKPLGLLIAGVILVAVSVSWATTIRLGYATGGLQLGHKWFAQQGSLKPMQFLDSLRGSSSSSGSNWFWLGFGAVLTYGLMAARSRFLYFPLHPLGYLTSLAFPSEMFWMSIFMGWLFKVLIGRFGGADAVKRTTPLFLGLVLGDVSAMLLWLIVDGFTGRTGHLLMPG